MSLHVYPIITFYFKYTGCELRSKPVLGAGAEEKGQTINNVPTEATQSWHDLGGVPEARGSQQGRQ